MAYEEFKKGDFSENPKWRENFNDENEIRDSHFVCLSQEFQSCKTLESTTNGLIVMSDFTFSIAVAPPIGVSLCQCLPKLSSIIWPSFKFYGRIIIIINK